MVLLTTLAVIAIKAYWDNKNWGNVDHTKGIFLVALVLIPLSIIIRNPYPLFLFGALWNPTINKVRRLPFFYIGKTSTIDKILTKLFGKAAGIMFFIINVLCLVTAIGLDSLR